MTAEAPRLPVPFVVGVGRSGTTLLRLMLDAHPELAIPHHTFFLPLVFERCSTAHEPHKTFIETVTTHKQWPDFHLDPETLAKRVREIEPFDLGDAVRAFYVLYAEGFGKPRWGDKTPDYIHHMEQIQEILPEARFIHLIRDGRDVAVSNRRERELAGLPVSFRAMAKRWTRKIREARDQATRLRFYFELRYEDLVSQTQSVLKEVCRFIELAWDPHMLEYHRTSQHRLSEIVTFLPSNARSVEQRRGRHAWTSRPPEATRVGRWREEMSVSDRADYEKIAGDLLAELAYATTRDNRTSHGR